MTLAHQILHAPTLRAAYTFLRRDISSSPPNGLSFLELSPIETALLAFFFIFGFITIAQLFLSFLFLVLRRIPNHNYRLRVPFILLSLAPTLVSLLASYILAAIIWSQSRVETLTLTTGVYAAAGFTENLAPVFLYAGLLFLLAHRTSARVSPSRGRLSTWGTLGWVVVGKMLAFMTLCCVALAAIEALVMNLSTHLGDGVGLGLDGEDTNPLLLTVNRLQTAYRVIYGIYLGVYCLLTGVMVGVAAWLWKSRRCDSVDSPREWVVFDYNVLRPLVFVISPLLIVRALFEIADEVAAGHKAFAIQIDFESLSLASLLIEGLTQAVVIAVALLFGYPVLGRAPVVQDSETYGNSMKAVL
ncbi:hypothetical protein AX17_004211 [Amanita inopinata Kibby_2008]|nr:hypothetical protein AX17_004345 [Amanita inopinata Kibby_2008]KAF8634366.1 hypothetical protein AX17_004211 [Amanita inopinata Kibby_2008]